MRCTLEQVRSAVADLYLLKEYKSPKNALLAATRAHISHDITEEKASLALAEATLLTSGPGELFKAALKKAEVAADQTQGPQLQFHLLQLQGYAAVMRRQPLKALHFAKESKMLAENLVSEISKPSEAESLNSLDWLEHLAQSYSLISVSAGLCGEVEDSRGAAQKLVQLGREAKQFHLEAYGEILLATQALARCELPLSDTTSLKHLHHLQLSRRCKDIDEAYAAANMAWQIMRSDSSERFVSLRSAALLRISQALGFKGQVHEAQKLLQEELRQARLYRHRGLEAGILIAWASIDQVEALQRLRMLGSDGERGQMEVAFRSTTSSNQIWQDDVDLSAWDTATSYLQNALTLARAHQDFISEVTALQRLTQLHLKIGLQPPRSTLRSRALADLGRAVEESLELQGVTPLSKALEEMEESGYQVDELLSASDIKQAVSAILSAEWWSRSTEVPAILVATQEGATNGIKAPQLSMVEVAREKLYCDVRVAGVQYGPRYRQVQGFIPPGRSLTSAKPVVVGVLRSSSEAEEWESRSWDWAPPLVDAAAHSAFLFGQKKMVPTGATRPKRVNLVIENASTRCLAWCICRLMAGSKSHSSIVPALPQRSHGYHHFHLASAQSSPGKLPAWRPFGAFEAAGIGLILSFRWVQRKSGHVRCPRSTRCLAVLQMEDMEYSPLPAAEKSWALVTGAATGLGWKLAKACANAGYGLILTDQVTSLQGLEESYKTLGLPESRILKMPMNLADPSEGVALLHRQIRQQGLDVCILFVCSDQYSYTGNFLEQRVDNLDTMLALNVGATTVLCRLFGEDMLKAGRGRILLIGAPAGASLGVAGASAFAGSMAFIRTLSNGLRREFADTGVGISCMETSSLGRDGSLTEALGSTCVGFLVKDDVDAKAAVVSGNRTSTRAAKAVENFTPKSKGDTEAMIDEAVNDEYLRLAAEEGFTPLPLAAEIDRFQHAPLSEVSSALLVGLALMIYVLARSPGISEGTIRVLEASTSAINALFTLDYLARWWCRGLRLSYLMNPIMLADLASILPFLLRPWVPQVSELELTFLKLIRVQRIYRFFRPKAFKSILRILLGPDQAQPYEDGLREVRPYQLQVLRTFGVVFTLLFITAALFYEAEQVVNPQFGDIFSSFYFSTIALSTVGFGDIAPMTPQGRLVITVAVIVGLCLIPSEASLVATAIAEEQRLQDEQEAEKALAEAERAEAQLAWDAARIAELEDQTREERARLVELEEQAKSWTKKDSKKVSSKSR